MICVLAKWDGGIMWLWVIGKKTYRIIRHEVSVCYYRRYNCWFDLVWHYLMIIKVFGATVIPIFDLFYSPLWFLNRMDVVCMKKRMKKYYYLLMHLLSFFAKKKINLKSYAIYILYNKILQLRFLLSIWNAKIRISVIFWLIIIKRMFELWNFGKIYSVIEMLRSLKRFSKQVLLFHSELSFMLK